jgi:hypothetical protein
MTNRLSILGRVNGGGRGVYGDFEKLGGFRLNLRFTLRRREDAMADKLCDLRVGGFGREALVCECAAADPATAGHSRAPKEGTETAQRARLYAEVGNGGKGFSILLGNLQGVGKGRKNSQQIPTKSGNENPDFVGEMEGGWEFPAFSRGGPLQVRNLDPPSRRRYGGQAAECGTKGKHQ